MRIPLKKNSRILIAFLFTIILIILVLNTTEASLGMEDNSCSEKETLKYNGKTGELHYVTLLKKFKEEGSTGPNVSPVLLYPNDLVLPAGITKNLESNLYNSNYPVFKWVDTISWIEWHFEIEKEGLYEFHLEYYMLPGTGSPAVRSFEIDDTVPFFEASNIVFHRGWKDFGEPIINSIGDEVRPSQVEIPDWRIMGIQDAQGYYPHSFQFFLEAGNHTFRMRYIDQDMLIGRMWIKPAEDLPLYRQVEKEYNDKGYIKVKKSIKFQAETMAVEKSDPTIRREWNGDPVCEPTSTLYRKLNVLGGYRWRKGNQSITWEFDVPDDGLYKIAIRAGQWWNSELPSYRQISIDGKVPFKELETYKFAYDKNWSTETLKDENDEPFLFFLLKGKHMLTMTVKMGDLTPVILSLSDDILLLSSMMRDITKLTGNNPDPNYDYEFFKTIPHLREDMEALADSLQFKYEILRNISEKLPAVANNLMTIKSQLENMIKHPFSIAKRINDLNNAQSSLGNWYLGLQEQPLLIDYFLIGDPDEDWGNEQSSFIQKLKSTFANFFVSFKKDYDNIGSVVGSDININEKINIWVQRGAEWAELIKEMSDEEFTKDTGIFVNVNIFPSGQLEAGSVNALMLAIASGKAPDGALGIDSNSPVEFAFRDAVYNLKLFNDFKDISGRFLPNIFTSYEYNGGVFALPETMNFITMIYRRDILEEYGITPPDTREELYHISLPILYQNGMQFYYPPDFSQFIYQHNAEYYLREGAKSGLETAKAYRAFKEMTELYTHYGIPVEANFFNRMRTGEMPIGIGDHNLYIQLSVAAPELNGRWKIAPIPGILRSDGIVDRSNGNIIGQAGIILNQSEKKKETWEFLKWWTSTSTQTKFAWELEAIIGTEARWNTANLEAFTNMAWKKEDLEVIKSQWEWGQSIPIVLGGYYTNRYINNAWYNVVVGETSVRDALEIAVEEINREIRMKREEYGIFDDGQ